MDAYNCVQHCVQKKTNNFFSPASSDNWRVNSPSDQCWIVFSKLGRTEMSKMAVWKKTFFKRRIVLEAILFLLRIQWVCFQPPLAAYFNLQLRREIKVRTTGPTNYGLFFRLSFQRLFCAAHGHTWWSHADRFDCVTVLSLLSLYEPPNHVVIFVLLTHFLPPLKICSL